MDVREQYERLLWGTMDALGVSESVARKVLAAVGIQFGVSIAQAALPWVTTGATTIATTEAVDRHSPQPSDRRHQPRQQPAESD